MVTRAEDGKARNRASLVSVIRLRETPYATVAVTPLLELAGTKLDKTVRGIADNRMDRICRNLCEPMQRIDIGNFVFLLAQRFTPAFGLRKAKKAWCRAARRALSELPFSTARTY